MMGIEEFSRPDLPDPSETNYVDKLIDACIIAFEKFGDDGDALNYMGVDGKLRPIVLENSRYKIETRKIQSEKKLQEIIEIEEISKTLKNDKPKPPKYDARNPDPDAQDDYAKDIKENLTLRLKVAEIRREILSVNKDSQKDEADALNIFFVPVTAAEFAALKTVEVHEGTEDASMKEQEKIIAATKGSAAPEDHVPSPFIIGADGSMEEIIPGEEFTQF